MSSCNIYAMVDPEIFAAVQEQIESDSQVKEDIREALKKIDKEVRSITSTLSRVHIIPPEHVIDLTTTADEPIKRLRDGIQGLIDIVKDYPYYKYNGIWSRDIQNVAFLVLFQAWLQRSYAPGNAENSLLTIEEVGDVLGVPVNLKNEDKFHLTIEEYLHAVLSLVEELTRLTTNAVTQHDFLRPQMINRFIKDIHSSFQVLNLKNDTLRRRGDALKYNVKKVEEVNYDLILRNLIPTGADEKKEEGLKEDAKEPPEQQK
ncbi:Translin [Choiromyces venosus 120613-1]|uniref:Translin n=1 Tax=Choiromyces venosus 120613-1 TaxID=1336337 RepID=A0A3N4IVH7_9PEZI|nr:Translin [Choiromyces venosus 120613-1]